LVWAVWLAYNAAARRNSISNFPGEELMKRRISFLVVLMAALALGWSQMAGQQEQTATDPVLEADHKILAEIRDNNELMANLEYLSDMIGPRLTGTKQMNQASRWTLEMFNKYGLANAHLESWTIGRAWYRGAVRARILSPAEHPLTIASMGWSPSTPGAVRGPVVYINARRIEDLQQYKGKLRGAIVITSEPAKLPPPYEPPRSPMLIPAGQPFVLPPAPGQPAPAMPFGPAAQQFARARDEFLKAEGVVAVLRDSGKPHGLLNMGGIGGRTYDIGLLPTAMVTSEGYELIWRLMKRGSVEVEVELANSFSEMPVEVYNTVAEIPGSEKPEEVVVLGGHLDSWDLGTGTTDNGTGSMVVLEAARALRKLDLKPKRTIRFILFSGEEQGLNGSRAYVEAHKAEMPKISGVLIHDTGTGRVLSIAMMDNYQDREVIDHVVAPLREVGLLEPSLRRSGGSDHVSFDAVGVPAFFGIQDPAEYSKTHHSQSDTFDKAWKDDLAEGAQVLAVWAYNVAQLPELLPRKLAPPQSAGVARE